MTNILKYLIIILMLIGCTQPNNFENKNTKEIIPILTEYFVNKHPFNSTLNKDFKIDEFLINDNFIVAIDTSMSLLSNSVSIRKYNDEYKELFNTLKNYENESSFDLDKIKFNDSIKIIKLSNEHVKSIEKTRRFKDFHLFLSFSRITYNENYDKAILEVSDSTSVLSGSTNLCFLKKINGKWKILGFQSISIS